MGDDHHAREEERMAAAMERNYDPGPSSTTRAVRVEHWEGRTFFAASCRFFIDVPLDMTGCIQGATRDAEAAGFKLLEGGELFATDTLYRGAILVEIEDTSPTGLRGGHILRLDSDVIARALPERGARLRPEVDELIRWSADLGREVTGIYVQYETTGPGKTRPTHVFAAVKGTEDVA